MLFLPRRWRIICFFIVTPWQIGVILTANYTFLNYLVLLLGVLLLDDQFLSLLLPENWRKSIHRQFGSSASLEKLQSGSTQTVRRWWRLAGLSASAIMLTWIAYATTAEMMLLRVPLPRLPIIALEPFRIANQYGLFAVMTRGRYEIEFQGSSDGENWIAYPFRYKPQALNEAPRIYAPYQPRFDWNLWFASLSSWRESPIVPNTEVRLLTRDRDVLSLFAGNPFSSAPPRQIRVVLWQYWFTNLKEKRATGNWWRRQYVGRYAPTVEREPDGRIKVIDSPDVAPRE